MRNILPAVVLAAAALTGCGAQASAPSSTPPPVNKIHTPAPAPATTPAPHIANEAKYDEADVLHAVGANENGRLTLDDGTVCEIAAVLTSKSQIEMYVNAGDAVVGNASMTAGAKVVGSRKCLEGVGARLVSLP